MSFLARFRVLTKIIAIVCLLSMVAGGITWLGVSSLKTLADATHRMDLKANELLMAQRLVTSLLAINRAEFELSSDPTPEVKKATRQTAEEETKLFLQRMKWLKDRATQPEVKTQLSELDTGWDAYRKDLDATFQAADAVKDFKITPEMEKLRQEALTSTRVADQLHDKLRVLAKGFDEDVDKASKGASEEYQRVSELMIIAAAIGIAVGFALAFAVGQFGIAKPMRSLSACCSAWRRARRWRSPAPSARTKSARPPAPSTTSV